MRRLLRADSGRAVVWALVAAVVSSLLGLGGFTFLYAQGDTYLGDSSQACANCHAMREEYEGWNRSSHGAIATCNGCHTPRPFVAKYSFKALHGLNDSVAFAFGNFSDPIRIRSSNLRVVVENCLNCHGELVGPLTRRESFQTTDCVRCHARVGH